MSDWQRECQRGTYEINPLHVCAQPFHEGLAAVMTGSEEDEAGRWGYTSKAAWPSRRVPGGHAVPERLAAVRQDDLGLYRRQGRLGHPPGLRGSNRLQRARHGAGPDRRARRAHRPPGPDSQDAAAGRAQLGFRPGQTLAEIEVPQPPRLFNVATGRALTLPDDVMALGEPTQGQIPAQRRASRYNGWWGLLSATAAGPCRRKRCA